MAGAIDGFKGAIAIDCTMALVTVTFALEEILPKVAETVDEPRPVAFASPGVPLALMLTTDGLPEVHCTDAVISRELPSVKVPKAASCRVVPSGKDGFSGEIASDASAAAVTVRVVLPLTPEKFAAIVVEPGDVAVATPVLEIVAVAVFDELQLAEFVRSLLLWSLYWPVARNCWPTPTGIVGVPGVIWIDSRLTGPVPADEPPPPQPTIAAAIAAIANRICNFFMRRFPLVLVNPKNHGGTG